MADNGKQDTAPADAWPRRDLRPDFPIFAAPTDGPPLAYLDNAATTHKPRAVIDRLTRFYAGEYGTVRRGAYRLGARATAAYDNARDTVRRFIGAAASDEIVFVRGATEGINLVASSFGQTHVAPGDNVVVTAMEHHANFVPWQQLCRVRRAELRVAPINDAGDLLPEALTAQVDARTRLVAVTHLSNVLGTVNPLEPIITAARAVGAATVVDGTQAVPRMPVNVAEMTCDFYVFSGHKAYGPTGIGVLYCRRERLNAMPPYQTGGDMVDTVTPAHTQFQPPPHRFEAGTPNVAGALGLATALDYLASLGMTNVARHDTALAGVAADTLTALPGVRVVGNPRHRAGVVSFVVDGVHPHDVATCLDCDGIAIRAGHHCAMPLMQRLGVPATARASFGVYTTADDITRLGAAVDRAREFFA